VFCDGLASGSVDSVIGEDVALVSADSMFAKDVVLISLASILPTSSEVGSEL